MTEESVHYICASQVHKSPATYLALAPVTRYKHIWRPDLPRSIFAMFSATVEHITRILLASGPQWWARGVRLHDVARSRSSFVHDYGMQTWASPQACTARDRQVSITHQEPAASPRACTASLPNSPWFFAKGRHKDWRRHLCFASILLAPSS
jgi:hypothetical protein